MFPLLYTLAQTPQTIGLHEAAYAVLLIGLFGREVFSFKIFRLPRPLLRSFAIGGTFILIFVVLNFATATANDVSLAEWTRGFIPFVFLLNFLPVFLILRRKPALLPWLIASVGTLMLLLSGLVIVYYVGERLWEEQWYIRDGGILRRISADQAGLLGKEALGPYLERVTLKIQKSTDALIPLAVICGFLVFIFRRDRIGWISLAGASFALVAVLMTYTRSMLLSCGVVIVAIFFWLAYSHRERLKFAFYGALLLAFVGVTTITLFGMEGIYFHRLLMLAKTSKVLSSDVARSISEKWLSEPVATPASREDPYEKDVNVTTRLEEYKIAWRFFLEAPIVGKGVGIQHDIEFVTSSDNVLKQRVGYVHNWPLYALMTGGLIGIALYSFILIGPIPTVLRHPSQETTVNVLLVWGIVLLTFYGLYFAVFRLITFNLLLAIAWGVALAARYPENNQPCVA